jgi:hypothetical protein
VSFIKCFFKYWSLFYAANIKPSVLAGITLQKGKVTSFTPGFNNTLNTPVWRYLHVMYVTFLLYYVISRRYLSYTFGFNKKHKEIMGNLLYFIAVILIILWAIGYLGYNAGGLIHILLVIALIAVILRVIQGRRTN